MTSFLTALLPESYKHDTVPGSGHAARAGGSAAVGYFRKPSLATACSRAGGGPHHLWGRGRGRSAAKLSEERLRRPPGFRGAAHAMSEALQDEASYYPHASFLQYVWGRGETEPWRAPGAIKRNWTSMTLLFGKSWGRKGTAERVQKLIVKRRGDCGVGTIRQFGWLLGLWYSRLVVKRETAGHPWGHFLAVKLHAAISLLQKQNCACMTLSLSLSLSLSPLSFSRPLPPATPQSPVSALTTWTGSR